MSGVGDFPPWVWDLLADLVDEEREHPKLYFTSGAFEGYAEYRWCPKVVLDKVPVDVRLAAEVIAEYRRGAP